MSEQHARILIKKYLADQCTDAERALVEQYFNEELRAKKALPTTERVEKADQHMLRELLKHLAVEQERPEHRIWRWVPYAAAVILILAVGSYLYQMDSKPHPAGDLMTNNDIPPGGNQATLTLANGRSITLDEARDGIIIGGGGITYDDGNPLAGIDGNTDGSTDVPLLELSTPKGGTYQITLSDGTRVWLNAASTLKYPSHFSGAERLVELTGEAYFSVVTDKGKPFKVVSTGQEIQVLGTAFNVSAYPGDPETKTTLVEGRVRLSLTGELSGAATAADKQLVLNPGEQATFADGKFAKQNIDVFDYTAWKDGIIVLNGALLPDVIRQVERWYNVEIELPGSETKKTTYVIINRTENLSSVLKALEETYQVKLKVEGRRVSVIE